MRPIQELLQIMYDHPRLFSTGLCLWALSLREVGKINYREYDHLRNYIDNHRPEFDPEDVFMICKSAHYFWESCAITPRLEWLEYHIRINQ